MWVHKDVLQTFPPQIYQRTESDWEWTTLCQYRNYCKTFRWKRALSGPQGTMGAEGCGEVCEEGWESKSIKKQYILHGIQEFLSEDAKETSSKSTSTLHVLCGSVVGLPDKIQDAWLNLNFSKQWIGLHCTMQYLEHTYM